MPTTINMIYWVQAQKASKALGWDVLLVYSQWQLESSNFSSNNLKQNNNLAGQTWTPSLPLAMKGTARPAKEGGYYVKYTEASQGYIDFVNHNPRYGKVGTGKIAEDQARILANAGWAGSTQKDYDNYYNNLCALIKQNRALMPQPAPKPVTPPPAPKPVYDTVGTGDTFWSFAKQYNTTIDAIQKLNPGVDPTKLRMGQKIRIK